MKPTLLLTRAFTFAELAIVMVVIAVLSGTSTTAYAKLSQRTRVNALKVTTYSVDPLSAKSVGDG